MRLGPAEPGHVHVLAGHAADHIRPGDEDAAMIGKDHHVGEGRPVGRPPGRGAEHHGDLRHHPGGPGHRGENGAHRVQALHALTQPGATGVPQPDHRRALRHGLVVGGDDRGAPGAAHGAALNPRIAGERDRGHSVDIPGRGQRTAGVVRSEQAQRPGVEQALQPQLRVARGQSGGRRLRGLGSAVECGHEMSPCGSWESTSWPRQTQWSKQRQRPARRCARRSRMSCSAPPSGRWCAASAPVARWRCRSRHRRQGRPG